MTEHAAEQPLSILSPFSVEPPAPEDTPTYTVTTVVTPAPSSDIDAALAAARQAGTVFAHVPGATEPSPEQDDARFDLRVELTGTGAVHLPREAMRTYGRDEALALSRKIRRLALSVG